ncbi:hypothetical protein [Nocardia sp. SYP-A9097]|uniref:hypothetical protein n=1 Tax=Nocardia sp. SYP-A9097 TaxID=2663237 RepID=UPI00129A2660|nr:hypothetical protein [Nocardia sp. SYP-A9097]
MNAQGDDLWSRPIGRRAEDAGAPRPDPVLRVLDEIDTLVEESMRDGEPMTGYDFDDPTYPECPNPFCYEHWHGLAITARMSGMRDYGMLDPEYDYHADDSPVLCPGSAYAGEWTEPEGEWEPDWDPEDYAGAAVRASSAAQVDPRIAQADGMWSAATRPPFVVWSSSVLLAFVSTFLEPAHWLALTPLIGIAVLFSLSRLFRHTRRALPAGYMRERLGARPEVMLGLALTVAAGWFPAVWFWCSSLDSSGDVTTGYRTLLFAAALAGAGHAIVQLSRIRTLAAELVDGSGEFDPALQAVNLLVSAFFWLILALPVLLLFGWTVARFTYQPAAVWAATGVVAISVFVLFLEAMLYHLVARYYARAIVLVALLTVAIPVPLLWWSLHAITTTTFHL